jgi:25S rRNA (adenine2142-N1)-methyltransferase
MKPDAKDEKLNAFEVGAINIQLQQCPWLQVRAIDVNSQHPLIEERDFFTVEPEGIYDVVVCSMVGHVNGFLHDCCRPPLFLVKVEPLPFLS